MDIKSKRITLVRREAYQIDLEYNEEFAIIHFPTMDKFTKSVYHELAFTVEDCKEFLKDMEYDWVFAATDPSNKLIQKFAAKFGFKYIGTQDDLHILGMEI